MTTPQFAPVFQDHAVLQRDILIPVWGLASPGAQVEVRLGSVASAHARTGDNGCWRLSLPVCTAGGPYALTLFVNGAEVTTLKDIWVGDVWLCSGQSNMQYTLKQVDADGTQTAGAEYPRIRLLSVATAAGSVARTAVDSSWQLCSPATISNFSAVGGWFGRLLHEQTGVAVGLICNAWGGTRIESWLSPGTLMQFPETAAHVQAHNEVLFGHTQVANNAYASADDWFRAAGPEDPVNRGCAAGWHEASFVDELWAEMRLPQRWQDAGHALNGIFWFRKTVSISAAWQGKSLTLELGAIDKHDETYVNGRLVGGMGWECPDAWCTSRVYTIQDASSHQFEHSLSVAVRVRSHLYHGGMTGPAGNMRVYPEGQPDEAVSLSGNWRYAIEQNWGIVQVPADALDNTRPGGCNAPSAMFFSRLHPVIPYGLKGFLWYQGESNTGQTERYATYLTALIAEWRYLWGQGCLPFGIVQLANYLQPKSFDIHSNWAGLREAQRAVAEMPGNGLAVCIDVGAADDVHPVDKLTVARRLLQWALADVYGFPGLAGGPALQRTEATERGKLRLHFSNADGLRTRDGKEVQCLFIAAEDGIFKPAVSRICGESLEVWHPEIDRPHAVRYAWADNPIGANLVNAADLPASPFKTH